MRNNCARRIRDVPHAAEMIAQIPNPPIARALAGERVVSRMGEPGEFLDRPHQFLGSFTQAHEAFLALAGAVGVVERGLAEESQVMQIGAQVVVDFPRHPGPFVEELTLALIGELAGRGVLPAHPPPAATRQRQGQAAPGNHPAAMTLEKGVQALTRDVRPRFPQGPTSRAFQTPRAAIKQPHLADSLTITLVLGGRYEHIVIPVAIDVSGPGDVPTQVRGRLIAFERPTGIRARPSRRSVKDKHAAFKEFPMAGLSCPDNNISESVAIEIARPAAGGAKKGRPLVAAGDPRRVRGQPGRTPQVQEYHLFIPIGLFREISGDQYIGKAVVIHISGRSDPAAKPCVREGAFLGPNRGPIRLRLSG